MVSLLNRLDPEGIDLKGRIVSAFFENPFLETSAPSLALRFNSGLGPLTSALADLCRCRVLGCVDGHYRFEPCGSVYGEAAALAGAYRGEDLAVRQQVVELETLARLREKLAVTHREVAAVLEMVPAGVLMLDRYGHLLKSNALARALVGLASDGPEADVCGRLELDLQQVLAQEVHTEVELDCPLAVRSRPFRVTGSEAGAVITVQDMTYRREMEQRAERLREEFFSMIRHELRKPLLTVERFLSGLEGGEPEAGNLVQTRAAVSHLSAMVDDMLFLVRLERDPMAVALQDRISLCFLLAGSDLAYRGRASEAGVSLRIVPPEEDVVFPGDERRLGQMVGNLLDNALKFTHAGGEVVLSGGGGDGEVWISVADMGPGIPEGERERVFGKFYQVRNDDGRVPGLGLGLAICRRVILAHGGQIGISDRTGGGTVVTVRIPVTADSTARHTGRPDRPHSKGRGAIDG